MTLIRWIMDTAFGDRAKGSLSVALFNGDREVGVPRVLVRKWRMSDRSATASVQFGPYDQPVSYDRYVLFADGEKVETIPEAARAQFPPGFTWEWNPEIILGQ